MKKLLIISGAITSLIFTGCACRTVHAIDNSTRPNTTTKVMNKPQICNQVQKPVCPPLPKNTPILRCNKNLKISVIGQGVAPCKGSCSPAQAYAMAKRAAIADAYRLIAEKVKGVYVEGDDYIKNMMVKRSIVRTQVSGTIRNANIVETTFKDGLCEVTMEVKIYYSQFSQ